MPSTCMSVTLGKDAVKLVQEFSFLRSVKVALKFSFCWGAFLSVCISDAWVGVFLFSD